jgi:hypothetical protein
MNLCVIFATARLAVARNGQNRMQSGGTDLR